MAYAKEAPILCDLFLDYGYVSPDPNQLRLTAVN